MRRRSDGGLTGSEYRCARVALTGVTYKEIGKRLGISEHTVKIYLHRAYLKLGALNRSQLLIKMTAPILNPFVQES